MLPRQARVRRPQQFRLVTRTGRRAGGRTVTAHLLLVPGGEPAKVGFVVSRAVGPAVVRNRVKRRLREVMRARLASLPSGCMLVVRAQSAAADASQADLAADVDQVLRRLLRRQADAAGPEAQGRQARALASRHGVTRNLPPRNLPTQDLPIQNLPTQGRRQ